MFDPGAWKVSMADPGAWTPAPTTLAVDWGAAYVGSTRPADGDRGGSVTTDLWMLTLTALLAWVQIMVAAGPGLLRNGVPWGVGNREVTPERAGWAARAHRASANMQENIAVFAILVIVAHLSGRHDDQTANGAIVFFSARALYALVYLAGIPGLRTAVWAVSVVGMGMIAARLVG